MYKNDKKIELNDMIQRRYDLQTYGRVQPLLGSRFHPMLPAVTLTLHEWN